MNESNIKTEIAGLASGMGIYTMLDCPAFANGEQFFLDMEGVWNSINSAGTVGNNYSSFAMIPANDVALNLAILNSQMQAGSGSNTTQRFIGLPALARNDLTGATGFITSLFYAPPFKSAGIYVPYQQSLMQSIGDSNFNQIYQYGIPASTFLYSDTAYAALPNATTLNAGQILAPPAYWSQWQAVCAGCCVSDGNNGDSEQRRDHLHRQSPHQSTYLQQRHRPFTGSENQNRRR
jgi:hypothetical protein